MADKFPILLWFRRDLRLSDHRALTAAMETGHPIIPLYIYSEDEKRQQEVPPNGGCIIP